MKRLHAMPFGAELAADGRTRFRLWAPRAQSVNLVLSGTTSREVAMQPAEAGWFEHVTHAPAGTRYAYSIDGGDARSDPASRSNPDDVHGPSAVVDPGAYAWRDAAWRGRPWHEAVVYELHVGTFTPEGTFAAVIQKLEYLKALGVTAIELMPVADFAGTRNWGYDGVLPFAPDAAYGTPDDLKRLIDAAHGANLMVLLDVVYNHFGPEGNYLHEIAPDFFNPAHQTPWGAAINFDGENHHAVREFFVHNALYWLEEYHFDGLRLDAVHAIVDTSATHMVTEITERVRRALAADRHVHLVLENDHNAARYLVRDARGEAGHATAQWNDDIHHTLHVLVSGERDGYYADYAKQPLLLFGRCLAQGFAYQGDWSEFRGANRGEPSADVTPLAFVNFLQNHDQVGNRAFGDRIAGLAEEHALRAAVACLLLAPSPPMLFMGEEFAASSPFQFFCDFSGDLAQAVTRGRREEFGKFAQFADPKVRAAIPDPNALSTFERSRLRWDELTEESHRAWLELYRDCLRVRRDVLVPHLRGMTGGRGRHEVHDELALTVQWVLGDGACWQMDANFSGEAVRVAPAPGGTVFSCGNADAGGPRSLPPWGVRVTLLESPQQGAQ
ncbi:MAG: malto-oligosyltrehalose trehalohydrolase [Pseudomonadota bacterium]|nr:malto-oligosyltrehalose trehalohydrolase [Pseudomonadota bacterium]